MTNNQKFAFRMPLGFVLLLLGINLLAGALTAIRLLALPELILLVLNYLCQLLTLLAQFVGLGGAFFFLLYRQNVQAVFSLLLTAGGLLLALLIAGVAESSLYWNFEYTAALLSQIASAFVNSLLYLLLYGGLLLAVYFLFFRKQAATAPSIPSFFGNHPVTRASLTASAAILVLKLILQVLDTVNFVDTYWPSIYTNEIITLIVDYIFLLLTALLGHIAACLTAMWLTLPLLPDEAE